MTDDGRAMLRLTLCATFASVLTSMLLFSVLRGGDWFGRSLGMVLLVAGVGAGLRALRVARPPTILAQAFVGFFYLVSMYASEPAFAGFVPVRKRAWDTLYDVVAAGFTEIDAQTPPVLATPGTTFIVVAGVGIMALLVDALAVAYRQAALAGLPLLVMYTVPAAVLPKGLPGGMFLLPAFGYLILLLTEHRDRMLHWGVPVAARGGGPVGGRAAGDLNRMSRRIGVTVLALAVVVPAISPGVTAGAFGSNGIGHQSGGKTISTLNPLVSLRRDLVRPDDFVIMTVKTDSARPSELYLRTVTLDAFDGEEWKAGRRQVQRFKEDLPPVVGLSPDVAYTAVSTVVGITDRLASDYLPMPYPTRKVVVPGQWRVDPLSGNVVSHKGRKQITGIGYTVSSIDLLPNKDDIRDEEPTAPYLQSYLELPSDLPARVANLAERVTRGAKTPLAKATALQRWFRDPRNFTYDLQVRPGTGKSAILAFLDEKSGYCEQFASTMAVMARSLGIPARVNVGFTAGRPSSDGETRTISSHDAHAWPELYMPGVGWTRFEPTPGSATSSPSVPAWLAEHEKPVPTDEKPAEDPTDNEEFQGSAAKPGGTNTQPECTGASAKNCRDESLPIPDGSSTGSGAPWGELAVLAFVLLLLATVPGLARLGIRWRRWSVAGAAATAPGSPPATMVLVAETAWQELRDSAHDLGYVWPEARTPRQTAATLTHDANLSAGAADALASLCQTVERVRYAPGGGPPANADLMRHAVEDVRRELAGNAERADRIRARVVPRSLLARVATAGLRVRAAVEGVRRSALSGLAKIPHPSRSR
jgi:transglutaminase-like putative cysteine protease